MTILGLDYGTKRIGAALATTPLAEPLEVINNNQNTFQAINRLVNQYKVDIIIIGLSEGSMAKATRQFATNLRQEINLPIKFFDETLSTQKARQQLLHKSKKIRSAPQDAYQAAIILQAFLDTQPNMLK